MHTNSIYSLRRAATLNSVSVLAISPLHLSGCRLTWSAQKGVTRAGNTFRDNVTQAVLDTERMTKPRGNTA